MREVQANLADWLWILRPFVAMLAASYTFTGAWLGTGRDGLTSYPVVLPAVAVALVVMFGFVYNDYIDRDADRLRWPDRPVASGRIRPGTALLGSVSLAGAALLIAGAAGWP